MTIAAARKPRTEAASATSLFTGQSTTSPGAAEHADDFVCDVLALLASLLPGLQPEQIAQADSALRERWGGDRPYIARRLGQGRSDRNTAIRRDYLRGESFELLERRYGLSKRQLIYIVKSGG